MPVIDLTPEQYGAVIYALQSDLTTINDTLDREYNLPSDNAARRKCLAILRKDKNLIESILIQEGELSEVAEAEQGEAVKPNKVVDGDMQC